MADVVLFTNGVAQHLKSVNTPDYADNPNAIASPDLSGVANVPIQWWKKSGSSIIEMTQAEKDALVAAELAQKRSVADTLQASMPEVLTALIKVINLRLPSNKITKAELVTAIKTEIV